jgi:hypothetical protein
LRGWKPDNREGGIISKRTCFIVLTRLMTIQLFSTVEEELWQLGKVSEESIFRKVLDHEDEQKRYFCAHQ